MLPPAPIRRCWQDGRRKPVVGEAVYTADESIYAGPVLMMHLRRLTAVGQRIGLVDQQDRRARVMELDPRYVDVAVRRWQRFTRQTAVHAASSGRYDVGYGKPPKKYQFPKGPCGNLKGRPKGSVSFAVLARRELNKKVTVTENGKPTRITKKEAGAKQLANRVALGDPKVILLLLNHSAFQEERMDSEREKEETQKAFRTFVDLMDAAMASRQKPPEPEDN
jgi:hypothetical protein